MVDTWLRSGPCCFEGMGVQFADMNRLISWFDDYSGAGWCWFVKRLSGNETFANGVHQAGPDIPKSLLFGVLPELNQPNVRNPSVKVTTYIDSDNDQREVRVVWYNTKVRDEVRMINFGGQESALLDPENTGALTIFAFGEVDSEPPTVCRIWVCHNVGEEDFIEDRIGEVEPGYITMCLPYSNLAVPLPLSFVTELAKDCFPK